MATDRVNVLERMVSELFTTSYVDVEDIRGMGLQDSKLETADSSKQDNSKNSVDERHAPFQGDSSTPFIEMTAASPSGTAGIGQRGTLPPMNELDIGVIESLPPEVFSEISAMYHGKLAHFITENRSKGVSEKENISSVFPAAPNEAFAACEEQQYNGEDIQVVSYPNKLFADMPSETVSEASVPNLDLVINAPVPGGISVMPASLSQVDTSVFQELPEELRTDILELLPAHRNDESSLDASLVCANNQSKSPSISSIDLWVGNPPEWIGIFKAINCQILRVLAEMYERAGTKKQLSSVLQRTMSQLYILSDVTTDGWAEAASCIPSYSPLES